MDNPEEVARQSPNTQSKHMCRLNFILMAISLEYPQTFRTSSPNIRHAIQYLRNHNTAAASGVRRASLADLS